MSDELTLMDEELSKPEKYDDKPERYPNPPSIEDRKRIQERENDKTRTISR